MTDLAYLMVVYAATEDDGGGYVAFAPDLMGCVADGETPEEAIADLRAAISEWIDEAVRQNREVPAPGAVAEKLKQERKEIEAILDNQGEIIKAQDALIESYREQIDKLREGWVRLEAHRRFSKPDALFEYNYAADGSGWPPVRRKRVLSVSH